MLKSGLTDRVEQERVLDFKFLDPGKLSPPVLQCNNITFGYPGAEILYSGVDFGVDLDSRVALVGPNGAGQRPLVLARITVCAIYALLSYAYKNMHRHHLFMLVYIHDR